MKRTLALSSLALALSAGAFAQTSAPTKVGIIHIQNAIIGTREGQKAAAELESRTAPKKKELEKQQAEIAALRDQLNKTSSVGSEDAKQKLMRDIDARTKSFNRSVEDAQTELDAEQNRLLNEIGGRMFQVIDKYSRDNGFAVVLDVSSQQTPVVFAATSIDITKEIIDLYDKNTGGGAAPAPATGAAKPGAPGMAAPPATARPAAPAPGTTRPGTAAPKR